MMVSETERMRRCRAVFEIATRDNIPMEEARRREAQARWAATDARLRAARCGTVLTPAAVRDDSDEGLAWWQR